MQKRFAVAREELHGKNLNPFPSVSSCPRLAPLVLFPSPLCPFLHIPLSKLRRASRVLLSRHYWQASVRFRIPTPFRGGGRQTLRRPGCVICTVQKVGQKSTTKKSTATAVAVCSPSLPATTILSDTTPGYSGRVQRGSPTHSLAYNQAGSPRTRARAESVFSGSWVLELRTE